jgi:propane monooxygenase reductase subunit
VSHKVRFVPVDIEIEAEEDETVLEAAFRQGIMLMHGCKEGQCSACKSFLLDGDLQMDRYSTFALADYESEEGYVLLCRAHAYSDLEVELVHWDEDVLRAGVPIQDLEAEVEAIEPVTRDIVLLALRLVEPRTLAFLPGQYIDITIPGTSHTRAFSMANTPADRGRLEFLIKRYPGGRFSSLLGGSLKPGDRLRGKGPYGLCTLRRGSTRDLVLVGGGAGMAPLLSLIRSLAEEGSDRRATYYYGARTKADLFHEDELERLATAMPGLRFVPALSEPVAAEPWEGEVGLVTDVLDRREGRLDDVEAYLCGPPPMIDAAMALLESKGVEAKHMHWDKFTITADPEEKGGEG